MVLFVVAVVLLGAGWQPVWVAAAGGAGVGVTGLATWLVARRRSSGSVRTSEAETLWNVSERLIDRLSGELEKVRERVETLEAENAEQRVQIRTLEGEVHRLRGLTGE